MSSPEAEARRIFGERAAYYTTSAVHTDPNVLARVVALADPRPEWVAIDIATGTGHTAFALAPHVARVTGLDLTPAMLAEAERLRARRGIENVYFEEADAHALPVATASVDLVACRRAAHHFANIGAALAEIHRVPRPGGRFVIDDRSVPEDPSVDGIINELDWLHDESHIREYGPNEWRQLLDAAGLVVDAVETYSLHRPLSSLTSQVAAPNVARINAIVAGLRPAQREAMHVEEIDGQIYFNHWYVMLAGFKP